MAYGAPMMMPSPAVAERMPRGYLGHRDGPGESFLGFVRRHPTERLHELFAARTGGPP